MYVLLTAFQGMPYVLTVVCACVLYIARYSLWGVAFEASAKSHFLSSLCAVGQKCFCNINAWL